MILRILYQDIPQQISDTFHLPKVGKVIGITSGMGLRAYGSGWMESGRPAESTG